MEVSVKTITITATLLFLFTQPACVYDSGSDTGGGQDVVAAPDAQVPDSGATDDAGGLDALNSPADVGVSPEVEDAVEPAEEVADGGGSSEDASAPIDIAEEDASAPIDVAEKSDASAPIDVAEKSDASADTDEEDPCEACLASGGTWQPEANACTQNCAIMDISCYTSSCPEPCSAASCGTCIGQEACEAAGCTWNMEGPAMWCN